MSGLRFGVVGVGYGQQVLVPAIRAVTGCEVVAISASNAEKAGRVAEHLNVPHAFGDWRALVASPEIDAVAIAVPPPLQPTIAVAAAERRLHLLCEKPLAGDLAGAEAIASAVRSAGVVAAIDLQFRFIPAFRRARAQLEAGAIGKIRHGTIVWHVETYANRHRLQSWKVTPSAGGGALLNMGPHLLYNIEWLCGPIATVTCRLSNTFGGAVEPDGDTVASFVFDLISGGQVAATVGTNSPAGSGHRLEIYGDDGVLALTNSSSDYMAGFELAVRHRDGPVSLPADDGPPEPAGGDGRIPPVRAVVQAMLVARDGGSLDAPGVADGLRVQMLLDAALRSAVEGRTIAVGQVGAPFA